MKKSEINVGIIGLGLRGISLMKDSLKALKDVKITALCDLNRERIDLAISEIVKIDEKSATPFTCEDYHDLLNREITDAVIIATDWQWHIPIACEAMEKGIIVGCEVAGAYSIEDCFTLVKTYEKTKTPIMFLENCCFARDEMMVLNMAKQGVLGEIVHCQGGYRHDIRELCVDKNGSEHFRAKHFAGRCCDYYPTHDLGPIAKILELGNKNRMVSLVSVASKAAGLADYAARSEKADDEIKKMRFKQGDVITTIIKCSNGETIVLFLDTTLPRLYSRGLQVQGTRGMFCEDNASVLIEGEYTEGDSWDKHWSNLAKYRERYDHPLWQEFLKEEHEGGHGGIDLLMLKQFYKAIKDGANMPIDVYDMAEWKCVTVLSEQSIERGGEPQLFPDFRRGKWL